jgi:hypothetical protein
MNKENRSSPDESADECEFVRSGGNPEETPPASQELSSAAKAALNNVDTAKALKLNSQRVGDQLGNQSPTGAPQRLPHLERILSRLSGLVSAGPNKWRARCPAHDDHEPSLSIGLGDDGRVLLHCFAGCSAEEVVLALGLDVGDLFPPTDAKVHEGGNPAGEGATAQPHAVTGDAASGCTVAGQTEGITTAPPAGCTLEQYAAAKQLPIDFLRRLGLSDCSYAGVPAIRIPYEDETGRAVSIRYRGSLTKDHGADNRFRWKAGAKVILYGLPQLIAARQRKFVVLVEGESDCHTLWHSGFPALGLPGATNWREDRDAIHLDGFDTIYVVIEPDEGGEAMLKWLRESKIRDRVRLVRRDGFKDPSDLYLADPAQFGARFNEMLKAAVPWAEAVKTDSGAERKAAWAKCETLARSPRILDSLAADVSKSGVAGESRATKLLFLVVVSRLLDRIVNLAIKGPTAGGKSFLVEKVLGFFPESAYYALSAMSEHALAYSKEPLEHRFLVLYEAVALSSEFASYLLRSLLSEGRVRYETVEKTEKGIRARLIEREGPTGLIITTTSAALHPENETRLLSLTVTDTPEQTKSIMRAQADEREVSGAVDLAAWHALQAWLETGDHRVTVPFAMTLAESIPPVAVRLRRDFQVILNLIRAHALLHQATRDRTSDDAVIATIEDYSVVRELVADLVAEGLNVTASEETRQTVAAVAKLATIHGQKVTVTLVAKELNVDKSTASRRVYVAERAGYLKNLESRKYQPKQLVIGDPLPEEITILPTPEALAAQHAAVSAPSKINAAGSSAGPAAPPGDEATATAPEEARATVSSFLSKRCRIELDFMGSTPRTVLYTAYREWCRVSNQPAADLARFESALAKDYLHTPQGDVMPGIVLQSQDENDATAQGVKS